MPNAVGDAHKHISSLESLFCYDKSVPEERIEKPTGLSLAKKNIGDKPHCPECEAKGAVLCATCSGSGLYVDSIMESQGIIVKVRCLGKFFSSSIPFTFKSSSILLTKIWKRPDILLFDFDLAGCGGSGNIMCSDCGGRGHLGLAWSIGLIFCQVTWKTQSLLHIQEQLNQT